jgi:hypothetical protein
MDHLDWLADINPAILSTEFRNQINSSKENASTRLLIESRIPSEHIFTTQADGKAGQPSNPIWTNAKSSPPFALISPR